MNGVLISTAGFTAIAVALIVTEFIGRRRGRRRHRMSGLPLDPAAPTAAVGFAELIRGMAALPGGRAVLLASWCWVGWHLLAR